MEVTWWDAACRGQDPLTWFPTGYNAANNRAQTAEAKRVCSTCTIKAACLKYELAKEGRMNIEGRAGIWGGLDEKERYALAFRKPGRAPLPCGQPTQNASYKRHLHAGETCAVCRPKVKKKRSAA